MGGSVMKKVALIGTAVAALMGGPALAADMPLKAPQASAYYNWTGLYGGIHAGYGWADTSWTFPQANFYSPAGAAFDTNPNGGIGGFHAGYNIQFNQFVLGVEGSYSVTTLQDRVTGFVPVFPADTFHTLVKDLASVTGRLGLVWGSSLIYVMGGWVTAEIRLDGVAGPPVPGAKLGVRDRHDGWTVGGGLEWMLAPNWIVGLEYNYYRLEGATYNLQTFGAGVVPVRIVLDDITINAVLGRVSYKF